MTLFILVIGKVSQFYLWFHPKNLILTKLLPLTYVPYKLSIFQSMQNFNRTLNNIHVHINQNIQFYVQKTIKHFQFRPLLNINFGSIQLERFPTQQSLYELFISLSIDFEFNLSVHVFYIVHFMGCDLILFLTYQLIK